MSGDELRETSGGKGIPKVSRSWIRAVGDPTEHPVWTVTFPDIWEWDCCKLTEFDWRQTWSEAIAFALARSWEK